MRSSITRNPLILLLLILVVSTTDAQTVSTASLLPVLQKLDEGLTKLELGIQKLEEGQLKSEQGLLRTEQGLTTVEQGLTLSETALLTLEMHFENYVTLSNEKDQLQESRVLALEQALQTQKTITTVAVASTVTLLVLNIVVWLLP